MDKKQIIINRIREEIQQTESLYEDKWFATWIKNWLELAIKIVEIYG